MVLASVSSHISWHFPSLPVLQPSQVPVDIRPLLWCQQPFGLFILALYLQLANHSYASDLCSNITFTRSLSQLCYLHIKMLTIYSLSHHSRHDHLYLIICLAHKQRKKHDPLVLFPSLLCLIINQSVVTSHQNPLSKYSFVSISKVFILYLPTSLLQTTAIPSFGGPASTSIPTYSIFYSSQNNL